MSNIGTGPVGASRSRETHQRPFLAQRGASYGERAGAKLTADTMTNLLEQAINCDDGDRAAKLIQDALGIESDDVVNYCFPVDWPDDREQRARYIGTWLATEARYLGS
jgi:hypothetical protein